MLIVINVLYVGLIKYDRLHQTSTGFVESVCGLKFFNQIIQNTIDENTAFRR
jgi:hypothetical protein